VERVFHFFIKGLEEQLEEQGVEMHQLRAIASEKTAEVNELTRELEQLRRAVRYCSQI